MAWLYLHNLSSHLELGTKEYANLAQVPPQLTDAHLQLDLTCAFTFQTEKLLFN